MREIDSNSAFVAGEQKTTRSLSARNSWNGGESGATGEVQFHGSFAEFFGNIATTACASCMCDRAHIRSSGFSLPILDHWCDLQILILPQISITVIAEDIPG